MENSNTNSAVLWTIIIIVLVIVGGIIYYRTGSGTTVPAAATTAVGGETGAPMIPYYTLAASSSPALGTYLVAANGMTLYTYDQDTAGSSTCSGTCATQWPPYTVSSSVTPTTSTAVIGQVGFITRTDGTTQVTYNGMPLYFWQGDVNPGDVTGNGISGFTVAKP